MAWDPLQADVPATRRRPGQDREVVSPDLPESEVQPGRDALGVARWRDAPPSPHGQAGGLLELSRPRVPVHRLRGTHELAERRVLPFDVRLLPIEHEGRPSHDPCDHEPVRRRAQLGEGSIQAARPVVADDHPGRSRRPARQPRASSLRDPRAHRREPHPDRGRSLLQADDHGRGLERGDGARVARRVVGLRRRRDVRRRLGPATQRGPEFPGPPLVEDRPLV